MSLQCLPRDVEQLSDLSDNSTLSDTDTEEENLDHYHADGKLTNGDVSNRRVMSPGREVIDLDEEMEPVSTEGEETDPKFVIRPSDVTVVEGEVTRVTCQVEGTEPLGE